MRFIVKFLRFCGAILFAAVFTSNSYGAGPFTITNENNLAISWRGKPLIRGEYFSCLTGNGFDVKSKRSEKISSHQVVNHFGQAKNVSYRREAVLKDNGQEVEISFQFNVPAYSQNIIGKKQTYEIIFDYKDLANWHYTAITNHPGPDGVISGQILLNTPDGPIIRDRLINKQLIRQIALESPDGSRNLVIDCSPEGYYFSENAAEDTAYARWQLYRQGNSLHLAMSSTPRFYGGVFTGKVMIYEGTAEDYKKRHALLPDRYYKNSPETFEQHHHHNHQTPVNVQHLHSFTELRPERQIVTAAQDFGEMYRTVNHLKYNNLWGFGWLAPDKKNMHIRSIRGVAGAAYSAMYSTATHTLRMGNLRQGLHLFTFLMPGYHRELSGMSIDINGKAIVSDQFIKPHTMCVVTTPVWVSGNTVDITFSGEWQLSAISDQLLLTDKEDFTIKRGFWLSNQGPYPSELFKNLSEYKDPEYKVTVSEYPLPDPGREMQQERQKTGVEVARANFFDGTDWRHEAILGAWGPAFDSAMDEFSAPGAIEKRIEELHNDKVNTVIINGMASRISNPEHKERIQQTIAKIVKCGQPHNMKFIDHWHFSPLTVNGSGLRVMLDRLDQLQRTVDCALPGRGLCPVNPRMRRDFINSVLEHIEATGIDGLMIDKVEFHTANLCGCADCRKKFTADTNWVLPVSEVSALLDPKNNSPMRQAWLDWQQKAVGDFWVELRNAIKSVKPDLVFFGYTSLSGLCHSETSRGLGSSMEQFARTWDFLGTDILTNNSFASFRSLLSLRKMQNMYKNVYNLPTFGQVYSDSNNWDVMYFGWALNNLNAQNTWEVNGINCPSGKPNYRLFDLEAGNMDRSASQSMAQIGMYFSNYSRDCQLFNHPAPVQDIMGFSQVMSANHIPHEFIFEDGLTDEILSRYKVLFINNATAITEEDVLKLRQYVEQGGIVYLSGYAGYCDDISQKHKEWPVGIHLLANSTYGSSDMLRKFTSIIDLSNEQTIRIPAKSHGFVPYRYVPYQFSQKLTVLWNLVWRNNIDKAFPGLVMNQIGKGYVYFSPVAFGCNSAAFEVNSNEAMTFEKSPAADELVLKIIKIVLRGNEVWIPENIPSGVITSLYNTQDGRIVVHFLNAVKSVYEIEDVIPSDPPRNMFAPLTQEMSFTVKYSANTSEKVKAYAVSPEFKGRKLLPVQVKGEYVKVTIPRNTLGGYMIVYIE